MLQVVNNLAGSILGAPDFGIGIRGVLPFLVGGFAALAAAVEPGHRGGVLRIHARLWGQFPDVILIALFIIAPGQPAQAGMGFHHAAVDAKVPPLQQSISAQPLQHHFMRRGENLLRQTLAEYAQTGVIGRLLGQRITLKPADDQRVRAACGNAPLAADPLQKSHFQHFENHGRIHRRPACRETLTFVTGSAEPLDLTGKVHGGQTLRKELII